MVELNRREFLSSLAVGSSIGLSGCIGPFKNDDSTSENGTPSIEIVSPSNGDIVSLTFNVRVNVENYNIRPLDLDEDYGTVDILINKDFTVGEEVPKGRGYFGFGQGRTEGEVEVQMSGEYDVTAVITDKNDIVTEYYDTITVEAQKQYEFTNIFVNAEGTEAYKVYSVTPKRELDSFLTEDKLNDSNPTMKFIEGESYKIYLGATGNEHPFEIQDEDGNPLLSMENEGELESVESVQWSSNSGIIEFTATKEFVNRADKYVCTVHTQRMNGEIVAEKN
jgi:hypothetical protein